MRILNISPLLPYPLVDGGRKGIYYPMKYLAARGHEIHFASLAVSVEKAQLEEMRRFCSTVDVVESSKKRTVSGLLRSSAERTPYLLSRFHNAELLNLALERMNGRIDLVYIDGLHCAYYGLQISRRCPGVPMVLKLHNVESLIVERFRDVQRNPFVRAYASLELRKMKRYEASVCRAFDRILFVSQPDEQLLLRGVPGLPTAVIPAGVDPAYFSPGDASGEDPDSIFWIGTLDWPPNQDSLIWFVEKILPGVVARVPGAMLTVVGNNPPARLRELRHANMRFVGSVDDVRPYMSRSAVCVVPLRVGGGVRLKLLEMFSMKKAVVATPVGCEGLGTADGVHLLLREREEDFAAAVAGLLGSPSRRRELGENAHAFVLEKFTWERIAEQYESILESVVKRKKARAA